MTVTFAPRINSVPRPLVGHSPKGLSAKGAGSTDSRRDDLEQAALRHDLAARAAAERGEIDASARSILALLDCERRLRGAGPQVLQVIKPRN